MVDKAFARLGLAVQEKVVIDYTGGAAEKKKKSYVTEATIDAAALGFDECKRRVSEHEDKIKRLEKKIDAAEPTKKNKSAGGVIFVAKEEIEILKGDGDYRAALSFVRNKEMEEQDRLREEREKEELEGVGKGGSKAASGSADVAFEPDGEVAAVVQSAVEGSDSAITKLRGGAGTMTYASVVKAEVATIAFAGVEKIPPKLKRLPTRDDALKTIQSLLWCPPAVMSCFPVVLMMLGETKLKSQPGGTCTELCTKLATVGPNSKVVPEMLLPALLQHTGIAAGANWQVKVACLNIIKDVVRRLAEPACCPRQLTQLMPQVLEACQAAALEKRKEVKKAADEAVEFLQAFELPAVQEGRPVAETAQLAQTAFAPVASSVPAPIRTYVLAAVVSCCVEAESQKDAEAAVELELRPLVSASQGSPLEVFGLKPVIAHVFLA